MSSNTPRIDEDKKISENKVTKISPESTPRRRRKSARKSASDNNHKEGG